MPDATPAQRKGERKRLTAGDSDDVNETIRRKLSNEKNNERAKVQAGQLGHYQELCLFKGWDPLITDPTDVKKNIDTLDICDIVTCAFFPAPHRVRCRYQLASVLFRLHTR